MITKDLHVHLHGCLTADQLWHIGRDLYHQRTSTLNWYADEYEKACGRRPNYLAYWQEENGYEQLKADYLCQEPITFPVFQAKFNLIIALCGISAENFEVQKHIIQHVSQYRLEYFEARSPIPLHFAAQQAYTYLFGLCQLVKACNQELTMTTKIVLSLPRQNKLALKQYRWIREFISQQADLSKEIVGIDFAFTEEGFPPAGKKDLFSRFLQDNQQNRPLLLLYHVGEAFGDKSLLSAIRWVWQAQELGADRLGHAIALGVDPENYRGQSLTETPQERLASLSWLLKEAALLRAYGHELSLAALKKEKSMLLKQAHPFKISYDSSYIAELGSLQKAVARVLKDRQVIIESCPSSNLWIGQIRSPAYHPLRFFHQQELNVTLCTDDPGLFATDWREEYALAQRLLAT